MPVAIICAPVSVAMSMIRSGVPSGSLGGEAEGLGLGLGLGLGFGLGFGFGFGFGFRFRFGFGFGLAGERRPSPRAPAARAQPPQRSTFDVRRPCGLHKAARGCGELY